MSLREVETEHIAKMLDHTHRHITKTAAMLGISRLTLRMKIKEYEIIKR